MISISIYKDELTIPSQELVAPLTINLRECLDAGLVQYIIAQTAIFGIKLKNAFT